MFENSTVATSLWSCHWCFSVWDCNWRNQPTISTASPSRWWSPTGWGPTRRNSSPEVHHHRCVLRHNMRQDLSLVCLLECNKGWATALRSWDKEIKDRMMRRRNRWTHPRWQVCRRLPLPIATTRELTQCKSMEWWMRHWCQNWQRRLLNLGWTWRTSSLPCWVKMRLHLGWMLHLVLLRLASGEQLNRCRSRSVGRSRCSNEWCKSLERSHSNAFSKASHSISWNSSVAADIVIWCKRTGLHLHCILTGPPVLSHGTFNQHLTESTSMEKTQHPKGCCVELGNWPLKVQLGSTNSKGLPALFQGSHQGLLTNNQLRYSLSRCHGHAHGPR